MKKAIVNITQENINQSSDDDDKSSQESISQDSDDDNASTSQNSKERRKALIDRILPARTKTISVAVREFNQLNIKAALQSIPKLHAEKLNIPHLTGYVEAVAIKTHSAPNKVIIHCRGNGEFYQALQADFIREAERTGALVVGFNYPSVGESSECDINTAVLVGAIEAVVTYIQVKAQVDFTEVTLKGHSLGGALATLAAVTLHDKEMPIRVVNGRSFSSLLTAAKLKAGFMANQERALLANLDLMMEAGKAFMRLPATHKLLICVAGDPVVPEACSVLNYLCEKLPEQAESFRADSLYDTNVGGAFRHICDLEYLTHPIHKNAEAAFIAFINKTIIPLEARPTIPLPQ